MSDQSSQLSRHGLRRRDHPDEGSWRQRVALAARGLAHLVATTFRANPGNAIGSVLLESLGGVAVGVSALWLKALADAIAHRDTRMAAWARPAWRDSKG